MEKLYIKKKVRFNEMPTFHMLYDDDDVMLYRNPYWELLILDRYRFKRRIECASKELDKILNKEHRQYIYNRFYSK